MAWTSDGYGTWINGKREVHEILPGLYQARLRRTHKGLPDMVNGTNFTKPSEAQAAADRLAADEAWTRSCATPAHDSDPITEPPEISANHGLFADSGGAYDE